MTTLHRVFLVAGLGAALAACGGGSSDGEVTAEAPRVATEVPASAAASPSAYTAFAASLSPSDTTEPLDVNAISAPGSETESPASVG